MPAQRKNAAIHQGASLKWRMPFQVLELVLLAGILGKFTDAHPAMSCDRALDPTDMYVALDVCKQEMLDPITHRNAFQAFQYSNTFPARDLAKVVLRSSGDILLYPKNNTRRPEPISQHIVNVDRF
jgi:hypothetical protein